MALDRSAREPIPPGQRYAVVEALWPMRTPTSVPEWDDWTAYFQYYTVQCRKAIEWRSGEYTTVRMHSDLVSIAKDLRNGTPKEQILAGLRCLDTQQRSFEAKTNMAEGSLRLCVRLVIMVDIGPISRESYQGTTPLRWNGEQSDIGSLLVSHFQKSSALPGRNKFEESFTAFNLQRLAGLEILWTDNLVDHLRLIENDTKLYIFHHVAFLRRQELGLSVLPDGLTSETLRTLAILFPPNDKNTQKWLKCEAFSGEKINLDTGLLKCDRMKTNDRQVMQFEFWRDELMTLKDIFDSPRSSSLTNFWYDRRNKVQWYTFWIAAMVLCLTVFFGIVQSIEGALQVYKAYHPTPK